MAYKRIANITEGVIWKQLLFFFFPILFGTFFQQLYNTADAVIVGQFVGKEALAAVGGSASVLINLLVSLFVGISSGATVVAAQYYGAQRFEELGETVHTSAALAVTAGCGMTVIGLAAAPAALSLIGTPPEIFESTLGYLRIYLLSVPASFLYNMGAALLRAVGDTRRPLYFLIISCVVNILLDLLLVLGLGLGVAGVAVATVLSQFASAGLVLRCLCRADHFMRLSLRNVRFTPGVLKRILQMGVPAGLQGDMYSISNIIIQSCVNAFGTNVIAAWTAFGKIDSFFFMVMSAYGISITTFVGQNFGARKYARMRKSVRVCLGMSLGTALLFGGFFVLFSRPLLGLFAADIQVLEIGAYLLESIAPFYFTYICVEILSGAIRGTGEALPPMLMTCFGVCLLRILWVMFILPRSWSIGTVVMNYPVTWAITTLLFIAYYLQGGWLRRQIAKRGYNEEG